MFIHDDDVLINYPELICDHPALANVFATNLRDPAVVSLSGETLRTLMKRKRVSDDFVPRKRRRTNSPDSEYFTPLSSPTIDDFNGLDLGTVSDLSDSLNVLSPFRPDVIDRELFWPVPVDPPGYGPLIQPLNNPFGCPAYFPSIRDGPYSSMFNNLDIWKCNWKMRPMRF